MLVIYPSFIAPLFNRFQPLQDEALKARVTALMDGALQGLARGLAPRIVRWNWTDWGTTATPHSSPAW